MAKIFTIAHQKGGVGKSTLALNLAACFASELNTGLVDTDVQGSLTNVANVADDIKVIPVTKDLKQLSMLPYDLLIIDTPPYLSENLMELFNLSDFVLIPTKPGFLDALAIKATVHLVKQVQENNPGLKAGIVLNMVKHRTAVTAEVREVLNEYDLPIMETVISDRVSYTRSPLFGSVFKMEDEKAKDEITELTNEIIDILY